MSIFDTASLPKAITEVLGFGESYGWQSERGLNPNLFVTLQDKVSGVSVRARIISYSVSNQAEWENKFEGTDGDSQYGKTTALLQNGSLADETGSETLKKLEGKTLITKAQSIQVWTGLQPQNITLELEFRAFNDAKTEVESPIQELTKMMSPVLNDNILHAVKSTTDKTKANTAEDTEQTQDGSLLGTVPAKIAVSLFSKRFNATYRIESMDESIDEMRIDGAGNRVYQVVSLTLGSSVGLTKPDIQSPSSLGLSKF